MDETVVSFHYGCGMGFSYFTLVQLFVFNSNQCNEFVLVWWRSNYISKGTGGDAGGSSLLFTIFTEIMSRFIWSSIQ